MSTPAAPIRVKRGNVGIVFADVFTNAAGVPIPLIDVTSIEFIMASSDLVIVGLGTVVDGPAAEMSYQSVAGDLDVVDLYRQEWRVVFDDGRILTSPGSSWNGVEVVEDLNPPMP